MSAWIRADADFGAPVATLVISARSEVGREFRELLGSKNQPNLTETVSLLCPAVTEFVERHRPDLRGLSLLAFEFRVYLCRWELSVVHPSLERVPMGEMPPAQRLEACWTCGKPLSGDPTAVMWARSIPNRRSPTMNEAMADQFGQDYVAMESVEVCSEACATAPKFTEKVTLPKKEIVWEGHPASGFSERALRKVLLADKEPKAVGSMVEKACDHEDPDHTGCCIHCQLILDGSRTSDRCSVCHFPLSDDRGAVGDKCSIHKG